MSLGAPDTFPTAVSVDCCPRIEKPINIRSSSNPSFAVAHLAEEKYQYLDVLSISKTNCELCGTFVDVVAKFIFHALEFEFEHRQVIYFIA